MKTNLFMLFVALSFGVFASCTSDEVTKVDSRLSIDNADENGLLVCSVTSKAQSKTVSFTSSTDWKAYVPKDVDWITVTPSSGSASSEAQTVSIAINANSLTEARTAYVDFICDKLQQKSRVEITQAQLYTLSVSTPKNVINKKGGDVVISVEANSEWTYSIDAAGQEWLTEKAKGATALTLSATPLQDVTQEKTAVLTFTSAADPTVTAELQLFEKDIDLVIKGVSAVAPGKACSGEVAVVTTNVPDWIASSSDSWITASKSSLDKLKLEVSANTSGAVRSGTVTLTASNDATVSTSIPVTQGPFGDAMTADLLDVQYAADGSAKDVSPKANPINYVSGSELTVAYNNVFKRYSPSFTHPMNSSGTAGYYYLPLTNEMQTSLDDGFTFEIVMKIDKDHSGVETKAFSSTSAGGLAIMISKEGYATFLINLNVGRTPSTWRWINGSGVNVTDAVKTTIKIEKDKYYHVVGTWDKSSGKACCYVNGVKISECTDLSEMDIRYAQTNPRFLGIGCNPTTAKGAITGYNGGWFGEVPIVKVFDNAMPESQAVIEYYSSFPTLAVLNY